MLVELLVNVISEQIAIFAFSSTEIFLTVIELGWIEIWS